MAATTGPPPDDALVSRLGFTGKADVLAASERYWNPGKTRFWQDAGVDLVIGRREGYLLHDLTGRTLVDAHLNGGTYNLGHRNPELVAALVEGVEHVDIGNHHFPSVARAALARALVETGPPGAAKVVFASGGGEAVDIALKTARHATGRRKIVSVVKAYHGHTGLAVNTGDERFSTIFRSDLPAEFPHVPFNDLEAMAAALRGRDVAAVIMETIPATYGFPLPVPGYLEGVKALCEEHGTLYIADEVQTGLMRTGRLWAITGHGIAPDILVTGKGLSGGLYPIAAVVLTDPVAGWLDEDGFAHMSTFGGAELGCLVATKVLEISTRPQTAAAVHRIAARVGEVLGEVRAQHPDWFVGIRQSGVVLGLEFDHPTGARHVMRRLYQNGVWAIFSTLDPRVLQYKPGLLLSEELCETLLERTATAIAAARDDAARDDAARDDQPAAGVLPGRRSA